MCEANQNIQNWPFTSFATKTTIKTKPCTAPCSCPMFVPHVVPLMSQNMCCWSYQLSCLLLETESLVWHIQFNTRSSNCTFLLSIAYIEYKLWIMEKTMLCVVIGILVMMVNRYCPSRQDCALSRPWTWYLHDRIELMLKLLPFLVSTGSAHWQHVTLASWVLERWWLLGVLLQTTSWGLDTRYTSYSWLHKSARRIVDCRKCYWALIVIAFVCVGQRSLLSASYSRLQNGGHWFRLCFVQKTLRPGETSENIPESRTQVASGIWSVFDNLTWALLLLAE